MKNIVATAAVLTLLAIAILAILSLTADGPLVAR